MSASTEALAINDQLTELRASFRQLQELLENYPEFEGDSVMARHEHKDRRRRLNVELYELGEQIRQLEDRRDRLRAEQFKSW
jgi:chromosome segregation ATPase